MPATQAGHEDLTHLARFNIFIEGAQAPRRVMEDLLDCTVENSIHLPDMCALRLNDTQFHWLDADTFKPGKEIEVRGGGEKDTLKSLFWGEVTALEMDLSAHGVPTLVIRCMGRSHRLHRGRFARSFVQMSDSDIVKKIGAEAGFTMKTESTGQVHDWVFQNNQTNWEFMTERAARNGFRLFLTGKNTLNFAKVSSTGNHTVPVVWGQNLRSFRPRLSAGGQVDEVIVRGWDPKTKRAILGKCTQASGVPAVGSLASDGAKTAHSAFGAARVMVADRPVHSQSEADALAKSLFDEISGEFLEAEGLCYGLPELMPGASLQVKNIGTRFSGTYLVSATTHAYTPAEGYTTVFSISGKRAHTLLSLVGSGGGDGVESRAHGGGHSQLGGNIVVAVVTDNSDPDNLGRVKVKYPWLTEEHTSFWARIASPMAGVGRGFYFLPEIDDEVLVAFEHGDIHRPYLIGALWNGKDKPVEPNSKAVVNHKVERRTIKTRIGHTILLDDTNGKGEMSLTTKGNHHLVLDDKNQNITAKTTSGHLILMDDKNQNITTKTKSGHTVLLDDRGSKIVIVDKTGQNKITIASTDNSMHMECTGNFSVNAKGKVAIEGLQGISIKSPMNVNVEGTAGVAVKSTAQLNLEGTAQATLKSGAMVTVQAAMVKIN